MTLAIIIPALNEAANIGRAVASARTQFSAARIIVVDGGSDDGTLPIARAAGAVAIAAWRGRGAQCGVGASAADAEWLLFLHADTRLPPNAAVVVADFTSSPAARIATFRLGFDDPNWFLRISGWCTRFDSVFTRFGDQGILVRRSFYESLGGFSPWPLFEDVDLLRRARRRTPIVSLPAEVITSARRFKKRGIWRQQLLNASLLVRFLAGASPESLAARYRPCTGEVKPVEESITTATSARDALPVRASA